MARAALMAAAASGATAVALGAFGAHALRARLLPAALAAYQTGVLYHFVHGLALLGVGVLMRQRPDPGLGVAAALFAAGTVLFSGSLYGLALGAPRALGAVTPLGGLAWVAAWLTLGVAAYRMT